MSQTALEQLEQAKQRVERANTRRNQIQVRLEAARQQYAEALKEAQLLVDERRNAKRHPDLLKPSTEVSLDLLRAILVREEGENDKAVAEFVRAVDNFEAFITRIEDAMANPEAMNALLVTMTPVAAPMEDVAETKPAAAVMFNEDDI